MSFRSGLATVTRSLNYINDIGVGAIRRRCDPMLWRLQDKLPRHGFIALTPTGFQGPYVVYAFEGARQRFAEPLKRDKIYLTLAKNKLRIAPSARELLAQGPSEMPFVAESHK